MYALYFTCCTVLFYMLYCTIYCILHAVLSEYQYWILKKYFPFCWWSIFAFKIYFISTCIYNACVYVISDFNMILIPPSLLFFIPLCFFLFVCLWVYCWFLVYNRLYWSYWYAIVLVQYSIVPSILCLMYLFYIHSTYDFGHLSSVSFILIITSF